MPLPPPPRPKDPSLADAAGTEPAALQQARRRARQRLVGALVLLVAGLIAFPMLFETEPRPLSSDASISIAQRDSGTVQPAAPPPSLPPAAPPQEVLEEPPAPAPQATATPAPATPVLAPAEEQKPSPEPAPRPAPATAPAPEPAPAPTPVPVPRPAPATAPAAVPATAASPARPAAEAAAPGARFVVQVGAFSDPATLREARARVERLGLKTYTQVIGSGAQQRTRVRVGPFETREQAEAALARLKAGGLPGSVLTL